MIIWITGIAGFLGSHLADALIAEGHTVLGNDNLICGDKANIPDSLRQYKDWHRIGCCQQEKLAKMMQYHKPDVVVHCAATAHEGLSSFSPSFITKNIYEASVSVFSAAIAAGVQRIVYMSSMSRYGKGRMHVEDLGIIDYNGGGWPIDLASPPFKEDMHLTAPVDPYGIAKVAAEDTLKVLCKTHGVKYAIAVPHNIIGIRQRSIDPYRNVAAIMINRCKQGKPPIIYGDGEQKRCFSPVKDCIPSLVKMVHGDADGEIVNIGPDNGEITVKKLSDIVCSLTGMNQDPIHMPGRPNEVKEAYCSSDKARKLLGYEPKQSLDECLKEMADYIQPAPFVYDFPLEIVTDQIPKTWKDRLM